MITVRLNGARLHVYMLATLQNKDCIWNSSNFNSSDGINNLHGKHLCKVLINDAHNGQKY